jgi:hypothetical protein
MNSIKFFLYLHVYTTAKRPIIKEAQAKGVTKHIHKNKGENKGIGINYTITFQLVQSRQPLRFGKGIYIRTFIFNTNNIFIINKQFNHIYNSTF